MCRFSFYTAFTISLAPIFRANMPLLHKFSCDSDFPSSFPSIFCSTSPCKSVFCSRFPCKYATFLKKRDFFCKCSFILCKNVNFMCLKKGIFLFYVPIFRANVSLCRPNLYFYHFCSYSPCKYVIFTSNFFLNLSHYVYFIRHNTTFVLRMLFYQRL